MDFFKGTFSDEAGNWSAKRVTAGLIVVVVLIGWIISVIMNGLGEHETALAETFIYTAGLLLGITPVCDAIISRRKTRGNASTIDDNTENVETTTK